jgi:hypothetical protein
MGPGGEFVMPAGMVSVLVALPGGPASAPPDSSLDRAATEAVRAHAGWPVADIRSVGLFAAGFARTADAVACALSIQGDLTADARPVLVAVHAGQSPQGQALDRCTWLARIASPGQVLLSRASASLVTDQLPAGADLADLGWHRLGDLRGRRARVAAVPPQRGRSLPTGALPGRSPSQPARAVDQLRPARRRAG